MVKNGVFTVLNVLSILKQAFFVLSLLISLFLHSISII